MSIPYHFITNWILSLSMLPPEAAVLPVFLTFNAPRLVDNFYGVALAASWNEFLMASQLATFNTRTLPVLIASFIRDRNMQWEFATASAVLSA